MKSIRRILLAFTALLLLAVAGLVLWFIFGQDRFYSSPTAVREVSSYEDIFDAPEPWPDPPADLLTNAVIITNQPYFEIGFKEHFSEKHPELPFEIVRVQGGELARIGDGAVRLQHIGIGWSVPATNFNYSTDVPLKFFTPELQPLDPLELFPDQPWQRKIGFGGDFPQVKFTWSRTNLPHLKLLGWKLFDATTHWDLNNSSSYGQTGGAGGEFMMKGDCQLWHPTPVELVVSFAGGPVEEKLLDPVNGAEVRFKHAALQLLEIYDHGFSSTSSSHDGKINLVRLGSAQSSQPHDPEDVFTFVFLLWPHGHTASIDIEALDHDGKTLPSWGGGTSGRIITATYRAERSQLAQIRIRYYSKYYRVVVSLPEIPGLPEENRHLDNLFATKVPFLRCEYEYGFQSAVKDLLQMDGPHLALAYPNGYFPVTFSNVTTRELFLEMSRMAPPPQQLFADSEQNRLEFRDPPHIAAWKRIKAFFRIN